MWLRTISGMLDLSKHSSHQMTYTVEIPITSMIEIEIHSPTTLSYAEILESISEVDLKEASLHLPIEDINSSFVKAVAKNKIRITA